MIEFLRRNAIYVKWNSMMGRCYRPKTRNYKNYGGRGIKVCKKWQNFDSFLSEIGKIPLGYEIDRIDNNGNYEPGNIRIVTRSKNCANKTYNSKLNLKGITKRSNGKYQARIAINRTYKHLGTFKCPLLAVAAFDIQHRMIYGF